MSSEKWALHISRITDKLAQNQISGYIRWIQYKKNSSKTTFPHIFLPVMSMPPPAKTPKALLKMADQVPSVAGIQCPAGNLGTGRIVNDIVKTR